MTTTPKALGSLVERELAAAAVAHMPCPEGRYWRRANVSEYSHAVKDGIPTMVIQIAGDDDTHTVYLVSERGTR